MFFLGLTFSILWLINFGYLFYLDRQAADIRKRLSARSAPSPQ